jgi:hypothetical protein
VVSGISCMSGEVREEWMVARSVRVERVGKVGVGIFGVLWVCERDRKWEVVRLCG